jgi:hypothetical protein
MKRKHNYEVFQRIRSNFVQAPESRTYLVEKLLDICVISSRQTEAGNPVYLTDPGFANICLVYVLLMWKRKWEEESLDRQESLRRRKQALSLSLSLLFFFFFFFLDV